MTSTSEKGWLCEHCETQNDLNTQQCIVCENHRASEPRIPLTETIPPPGERAPTTRATTTGTPRRLALIAASMLALILMVQYREPLFVLASHILPASQRNTDPALVDHVKAPIVSEAAKHNELAREAARRRALEEEAAQEAARNRILAEQAARVVAQRRAQEEAAAREAARRREQEQEAIRQAERRRAEEEAWRRSRSITFRIRGNHPNTMMIAFYSPDGRFGWPGGDSGNRINGYRINDNSVQTHRLNCSPGDRICFGAWIYGNADGPYWGCGPRCRHRCSNCCYHCGTEPNLINLNP